MAITSTDDHLYVANSGASQVLVLDPSGQVVKAIGLQKTNADEKKPRPTGLAVTRDGELLVSDAENHRVLRYDADGHLLLATGSGKREGGETGFNTPGGLALDNSGNAYVVDILNGRVVKLSPDGAYVLEFGSLGDTAGTFGPMHSSPSGPRWSPQRTVAPAGASKTQPIVVDGYVGDES